MKKTLIALGIIFLLSGLLNVFLIGAYCATIENTSSIKWVSAICYSIFGVTTGVLIITISNKEF